MKTIKDGGEEGRREGSDGTKSWKGGVEEGVGVGKRWGRGAKKGNFHGTISDCGPLHHSAPCSQHSWFSWLSTLCWAKSGPKYSEKIWFFRILKKCGQKLCPKILEFWKNVAKKWAQKFRKKIGKKPWNSENYCSEKQFLRVGVHTKVLKIWPLFLFQNFSENICLFRFVFFFFRIFCCWAFFFFLKILSKIFFQKRLLENQV